MVIIMKTCPSCDEYIDENEAFCQNCGTDLTVQRPKKKVKKQIIKQIGKTKKQIDFQAILQDKFVLAGLGIIILLLILISIYFFTEYQPSLETACGNDICEANETVTTCPDDCETITIKKEIAEDCEENIECLSENCCNKICRPQGMGC